MIKRLLKVCDGLFRGSAPSPEDVVNLHQHFGIKKIVSLDERAAHRIDRITKALQIDHITIPINGMDLDPIVSLLSHDLKSLLLDNGPTYVHCLEGKDRTGMVVAMFQCRYLGLSSQQALQEAKKIGFGVGLHPAITHFYSRIVKNYCKKIKEDQNSADIVDNSRPNADWRGSVLDAADMSSFAPYLSEDRQYPYDQTYQSRYDQFPTRNNVDLGEPGYDVGLEDQVPLVGIYEFNQGIHGIGPVEPGGAFTAS
jgi:Tyrosine phosphatase family